jgi:transcriptional/translational regulatory protein YebC/TACO1
VAHFEKKSTILIEKTKVAEDTLMSAVLDAGADDMADDGGAWEVISAPASHAAVLEAVRALGLEPEEAVVAMVPMNTVKLSGKEAQQMLKLMDALDDNDDTKNVFSNADIDEKEIEASLA